MNNNWRDLEAGRELDRLVAENAALRKLLTEMKDYIEQSMDQGHAEMFAGADLSVRARDLLAGGGEEP